MKGIVAGLLLGGLLCGASLAGAQAAGSENKGQSAAKTEEKIPPPRSVEAIAVSPTEIRCCWLPAEGATGYRLQRDGQTVATLPPDAIEFKDTGLTADSTHKYTLVTLQGEKTSEAREYTERTFADFPDPSHPTLASPVGTPQSAPLHSTPRALHPAVFDVVVVQASSGGVSAAVEAARRGLRVALIEPTTRIGGMPVNGLSATDLRRGEHASGFLTRFRDRVRDLYAQEGIKTNGLQYEPRIAHQAMKSLLYEAPNLTLFRLARLARVRAEDAPDDPGHKRVRSIVIEQVDLQGKPTGRKAELQAKVFIDATDCGDLAAWAGAPFRLGREPRSAREPHNGVIYYDRKNDKLLPGSTGEGDRRIQAYAYLLVVKDYGPNADKTIPMPPGYRKENYIHTPAWKESWAVTSGKMPNGKYELNQHPQGGDIQGINYHYPTDSYEERARLDQLHRDRVLGYLYYIQTEQGQKQLGLPDDEYRDTGGFPPLLYVREGRRILGEQLFQEADITKAHDFAHPASIGLGDYPMDSHAVRPKTDWSTPDMGEGEWWLYQYTPTHELPLGILIPKTLDNVFVTTAVSSTHVSFGTYRLEPVRMAFGQAAGISAFYCIRYGLNSRQVPARQIQDELLPHIANPFGDSDVILSYFSDVKSDNAHYRAIQYLAARGFRTEGETFKPEASTTRSELIRWLTLLTDRSAPEPKTIERSSDGTQIIAQGFPPYMGWAANRAALKELQGQAGSDGVVTRAEIAHWLVKILPPLPVNLRGQGGHYGDLTESAQNADAEALYDRHIDSVLWDNWDAIAPDGKLRFQPDAPLRHDALFATLYLAQIGLGPSFYDNPVDGRNGRAVPPALLERVLSQPDIGRK